MIETKEVKIDKNNYRKIIKRNYIYSTLCDLIRGWIDKIFCYLKPSMGLFCVLIKIT